MGFFGHLFSFFRRKTLPEHIEDKLEERRLRPRVNPKEGTRILVIDDSPTILHAMSRFLESTHCVFLSALDARKGIEYALTKKPDLIFLDIVMPGTNGFAALRALRKNSRTREIPIIMMSGNEQAKAQFFGAHIGADDFMKKPFSRFEVFARIARLLDADRVPRRPPSSGASAQATEPATASALPITPSPSVALSSSGEAVSQSAHLLEQPRVETKTPPAPPSPPSSRKKTTPAVAVPATPIEASEPILTSVQIESPVSAFSQPAAQSPQPHIHAERVDGKLAAPPQAQPEPSLASTHPVSAQVVPITLIPQTPQIQHIQPTQQVSPPSVSPKLLARIARLASLAQSDPEALKTLVVFAARLTAEYAAAEGIAAISQEEVPVTQTRATATATATL